MKLNKTYSTKLDTIFHKSLQNTLLHTDIERQCMAKISLGIFKLNSRWQCLTVFISFV